MFVRRKRNPSGIVSIQVIDKSTGKYRVLKTMGSSSDPVKEEELYQQGLHWIEVYGGQLNLFPERKQEVLAIREQESTLRILSNIDNILINGTQLILDKVFELVGFNAIKDDVLRQLVVSRLCQSSSKSGTVDYLKSHYDEDVNLSKIYRYLDKLYNTQQDKIQQISVAHTRKILGGRIGIVFYDVTTLYFETDYNDELRQSGFSKDGKHSQPQIVLGLLVSMDGYPLAYSIFNGSQYEGYTMIPVVEDFVRRFELEDFVVVADSGLMNGKNIALLESGGYKYIIGARIKNENREVKSWILSLEKQDKSFYEYTHSDGSRLIVGYSITQAKKDAYNREKGIRRLEKAYSSKGAITKENINKRGYNKFLDIDSNVKGVINHDKIEEDKQWDGLKGYLTNTPLSPDSVCNQYNGLWIIERSFRVTKGTLEVRPMFHFSPRRIQAHVCICFAAYKVYKELERILRLKGISLSAEKVLDRAKTITTIKIRLPQSRRVISKTMLITTRHKLIEPLFTDDFWVYL
jgi:Transposase